MNRCRVVGLNVTQRCNIFCTHCFYRFKDWLGNTFDIPLKDAMLQAEAGKARGCEHVVLVGWGEPALWPHTVDLIKECSAIGMTTSIITNGSVAFKRYEAFYNAGLNHMLVSIQGTGETADKIYGAMGVSRMQAKTLSWLKENNLAWRSDTTIQLLNYTELPGIIEYVIEHGAFHIVLLGFLPHYEWITKLREVAVHPEKIRPYAEEAIEKCLEADRWVTWRYQPFCHAGSRYYPYITNANFVLLDNGEWDYNHSGDSNGTLKAACKDFGDSFGIKGPPCNRCSLRVHCGGWNQIYANGFDGAGLQAVDGASQDFGYFWYQNPYNDLFTGNNRK